MRGRPHLLLALLVGNSLLSLLLIHRMAELREAWRLANARAAAATLLRPRPTPTGAPR